MIVLTMQDLRRRLARSMGDLTVGSLTTDPSSGATSLVDTKRIEADNHWNNFHLKIGEDASREFLRVSDSVQSTTTLTVTPATGVDHTNGTEYELTEIFSMEEYQSFLEMGILEMATMNVLSNLSYTGITLVADTWEYAIPNNFRYVNEIHIADSEGNYRESGKIDLSHVDIIPGPIPLLRFDEGVAMEAGRAVRILGQGEQLLPVNFDTDELEIDPAFILYNARLAAYQIIATRMKGEDARSAAQVVRTLAQQTENARDLAGSEHRAKPGSLVVA